MAKYHFLVMLKSMLRENTHTMKIELKVPVLPESISDALVAHWHHKVGDFIQRDDPIVDIETDKVVLEVVAPQSGLLTQIDIAEGQRVTALQCLGILDSDATPASSETPVATEPKKAEPAISKEPIQTVSSSPSSSSTLRPSERKAMREHTIPTATPTTQSAAPLDSSSAKKPMAPTTSATTENANAASETTERLQHRDLLSPLRQRIAQRLLSAQHNAAMLTTFNEVDMSQIIALRESHKASFEKKFGVKIGFMSFFMKAVSLSLETYPTLNAYIENNEIVYHNYCDIGVAVSSERGLIVPVVRDVQTLSFDDCEKALGALAEKARSGKITMDDLQGGTFTITNGGVFGSLLSTPILNPPQSAILGMHKIQDRAVVIDKQIVIRPMMYVALSYDHRLIDGAQAVGFLVSLKKCLEQPEQFFLHLL